MKVPRFLPRFKGFHILAPRLVKVITFNFAIAITLFPFVFYKRSINNIRIKRHESIHILQQMELGLVGLIIYLIVGFAAGVWIATLPLLFLFYILYGFFYLLNIIKGYIHISAYKCIPFEREARRYQEVSNYSYIRRPFAWWKYHKI